MNRPELENPKPDQNKDQGQTTDQPLDGDAALDSRRPSARLSRPWFKGSSRAQFLERVLITALVIALILFSIQVADVFFLAFGGILLALVIRALAEPLRRYLRLPEKLAVFLVIIGLVLSSAIGAWMLGGTIIEQAHGLGERLPASIERLRAWVAAQGVWAAKIVADIEMPTTTAQSVARFATTTFGALTNLFLIMVTGFYLALDPRLYRRGFVGLFPKPVRPRVLNLLGTCGQALKAWLLGHLMAMISVGLMTGIGLVLFGVPYALALGVLAALLEIIPVLGPSLAALPALLLLFNTDPHLVPWLVLWYMAVQQIQSYLVVPMVQKWAVSMPPALGLLAVVALGLVFGFLGVVFATPLVVVTIALLGQLSSPDEAR